MADTGVKLNPDKTEVLKALSSDQILSRDQFMKVLSPDVHGDISPPDTLDNFFNAVGISTPKVQQLRKAYTIEKQLDPIYENYLNAKLQTAQNPLATLGEAQGINPGFPVPPGHPQVPGTPPEQLGPPAQVHPPIIAPSDTQALAASRTMGEPYFSPRPETAPMVPDPNAILPRSYQNLLVAKTHQAGLRPYAPGTMLKSQAMEQHDLIATGQQPEEYPGQLQELKNYLGLTPRLPGANTAQGRSANAKASLDEQKAQRYAGLTDAQINQMQARAQADEAKAHDLNKGFDTRIRELESRITKNTAQGKAAGDLMGLNQERLQVQQAKALLAYQRYMAAKENVDQEGMDYWSNQIIDLLGGSFDLKRSEPSFLGSLFGRPGQLNVVPQGQATTGNPMQFPSGSILPQEQGNLQAPESIGNVQPQAETNPEAKKAQARALFNTMKEGEVKVLDGIKYKREGTKLVPQK